jgi:ABC-type Mn2+/Zn2+ transport system permease subunit
VIADFVGSWSLFQHTYLAGWLVAVLLGLVGVLVVARDQIFLGAAVAQASSLGVALGMVVGSRLAPRWPVLESDGFLSLAAVVVAVLAALVTSAGGAPGDESREARTGWIFLLSASGAILLLAHSPHGLEEIHRLVASTIIGATGLDVVVFGALAAVSAAALAMLHRPVLLVALDPDMAAAVGLRTERWTALLSVWLGLVVGLSIRVSGILYGFGCLVLPALVARNVCREVAPMFVVAPLVGFGATAVAFVVAHHWDFPPGQMSVALLCALVLASRGWRGSSAG